MVVVVLAVKNYVDNTPFFRRNSHIVFTESDQENFAKVEARRRHGLIRYVAVQVVSVASGVVSSAIYGRNWFQ